LTKQSTKQKGVFMPLIKTYTTDEATGELAKLYEIITNLSSTD